MLFRSIEAILFEDSFFIGTDDYSNLEKQTFHREIENRNRIVPRIYDLKYNQEISDVSDIFLIDRPISFKYKIHKNKKPEFEIKINLGRFYGFTDLKDITLAFKHKKFFVGLNSNKSLIIGYHSK